MDLFPSEVVGLVFLFAFAEFCKTKSNFCYFGGFSILCLWVYVFSMPILGCDFYFYTNSMEMLEKRSFLGNKIDQYGTHELAIGQKPPKRDQPTNQTFPSG